MEEQKELIVAIKYSEHTNSFFIDFSNAQGCIISAKITQIVAEGLSKSLGIKITH